jgi:hypothetical protein
MKKHKLKWNVEDNEQLSYALGIALPYGNPYQIYKENDLKVCVL